MGLQVTLPIAVAAVALSACAGYLAGQRTGVADAQEPTAAPERPAYMIVMGNVHDRENFMANYVANLPPLYERHGGRYLVVTGQVETLEGDTGFASVVMSEWPNAQAARDFWNDPDYRELANARIDGNWGDFNVVLVEGLPAAPAE